MLKKENSHKLKLARQNFRPVDTSQMHQDEYRKYLAVKLQGIKERESQLGSEPSTY